MDERNQVDAGEPHGTARRLGKEPDVLRLGQPRHPTSSVLRTCRIPELAKQRSDDRRVVECDRPDV